MRVVFSSTAKAELDEVVDYIAKGDARQALRFARELRAVALRIGDAPHAFPLVPGYESRGLRRRPFGNYLVFFRVEDSRVLILHIIHGARDYEPLLSRDV